MKCIYCLENKDESAFKKREHVIPQFFGKFQNNLVLKHVVCDDCNKFFGDTIELFWGRDSYDYLERLKHGYNPKDKLNKKKRIESKKIGGQFNGSYIDEVGAGKNGNVLINQSLQVGFFNKNSGSYVFFKINDIPTAEFLTNNNYDIIEKEITLIAYDNEIGILESKLKEKGIPLKKSGKASIKIEEKDIQIESKVTLDKTIMRGIAKVAFNYLAYVSGKIFVLSDSFNNIRRYIRQEFRR